jgi:hypothetical protein
MNPWPLLTPIFLWPLMVPKTFSLGTEWPWRFSFSNPLIQNDPHVFWLCLTPNFDYIDETEWPWVLLTPKDVILWSWMILNDHDWSWNAIATALHLVLKSIGMIHFVTMLESGVSWSVEDELSLNFSFLGSPEKKQRVSVVNLKRNWPMMVTVTRERAF